MARIKPDYSKQPKCFYCQSNEAMESSANTEELYCVAKTKLLNYTYVPIKVEIPRCKACAKKHSYACLPMVICFIVVLAIAVVKGIVPQWGNNSLAENLFLCFVVLFLSFVVGIILGYIPRMIMSKLVKVKYEDSNEDYAPIKKLISIGFQKTKPKPHTHPEAKFNSQKYQGILASIVKEDCCIIEK